MSEKIHEHAVERGEKSSDSNDELQAASDFSTEQKSMEHELEQRARYLSALEKTAKILLTADLDLPYQTIVDLLGPASGADRTYIFVIDSIGDNEIRASQTAEWCAEGVRPEIDNPDLPLPDRWARILADGKSIRGRVTEFPDDDKAVLEPQGIQAILILPVIVDGRLFGFIGFDNCVSDRSWNPSEEEFLEAAVGYLAQSVARLHAEKSVRESEQRFRILFEHASDYILLVDPTHPDGPVIVDANESACTMHGYNPEELIGKPIAFLLTERSRRQIFRRARQIMVNKALTFEAEHICKDGSIQPIEVSATLVDLKGKPRIFAIGRNVSLRKIHEKEVLRAQKLKSIGVMAGGIAHDFNNLLNGILGNVSLVKSRLDPSSDSYDMLVAAENATLRASGLTKELLTFSRGGAPVKERASIAEMLREMAEFALSGSNVKCRFSFDDDLHVVEIDKGQFSQVIQNLVINADQAMPDGGVIDIRAENVCVSSDYGLAVAPGDYIKISVKDQGVGIPKESLSKIFDPFFTTKPYGSGLGLATCYSVIQKHRGCIQVESDEGQGTIFNLYLPAVSGKTKSGIDKPGHDPVPRNRTSTAGARVLVMDDEALLRELLANMIHRFGYEADCAKDGSEAVALYQNALETQRKYDVVVLDLTVPGGMGGKETILALKALNPEVKAIVCSGYADDPVVADCGKYGFSAALTKPYRPSALQKEIETLIGRPKTIGPTQNRR